MHTFSFFVPAAYAAGARNPASTQMIEVLSIGAWIPALLVRRAAQSKMVHLPDEVRRCPYKPKLEF
jgi:hypothetical protein